MIFFFAGTDDHEQKDPRRSVGRDVSIMTTFFSQRKKKKRKLMEELMEARGKSRRKNREGQSRKVTKRTRTMQTRTVSKGGSRAK